MRWCAHRTHAVRTAAAAAAAAAAARAARARAARRNARRARTAGTTTTTRRTVCAAMIWVLLFASLSALATGHSSTSAFAAAKGGGGGGGGGIAWPPSGRWDGELTGGAPSGHLGNPGHHVPLLGNGYMGVVMQSSLTGSPGTRGVDFNGSTLDLFINTNVNWDCERSPLKQQQDTTTATRLPPAQCSMRGLGGLTVNLLNGSALGRLLSMNSTRFAAEQRTHNGSLWTLRCGADGTSCVQTETVVHSDENAMLTTITATATVQMELALWTLGRTSHVRASSTSQCTPSRTVVGAGSCSRRYDQPNTTAGFFQPWTAIGNRVIGAQAIQSDIVNTCPNRFECISTQSSTYELVAGSTIHIITTVADNLLQGNAQDPSSDALALALRLQPTAILDASQHFWQQYWNASAVTLPTRPALERMWFGSQFVTACASAPASLVQRWQRRLPPPGLYGPFATGDFAFWNGDFTLDCTYAHIRVASGCLVCTCH
jgi:hypothetical protein